VNKLNFEQGHCVLEMPSGTGKTVSLLALIVAYQMVPFTFFGQKTLQTPHAQTFYFTLTAP
jgi:cyclopropane fatty-acyl-phospholipid synthase-like methyltransferase